MPPVVGVPANKPSMAETSQAITAAFAMPLRLPKTSPRYMVSAVAAGVLAVGLPLVYLAFPLAIASVGVAVLVFGIPSVRGIYSAFFVVGSGSGLLLGAFAFVAPLFRGRSRQTAERPIVATAQSEPLLFHLIRQTAASIGADVPDEVHFTCEANAAVSRHRGKNILILGLPLVACLTTKQLGGLLGHELAHLRQGFARSTLAAVGRVFDWFRSAAQAKLDEQSTAERGWMEVMRDLSFILGLRMLRIILLISDAVMVLLGRQMELEADRFEVAVAGSGNFAQTMERLCAAMLILEETTLRAAVGQDACPDDLPSWAALMTERLSSVERRRAARILTKDAVGLPHPPFDERVAHARRQPGPGCPLPESPAVDLFRSFEAYAKRATLLHVSQFPIRRVEPNAKILAGRTRAVELSL
jgi:Zn-dependent protease with chaperone function